MLHLVCTHWTLNTRISRQRDTVEDRLKWISGAFCVSVKYSIFDLIFNYICGMKWEWEWNATLIYGHIVLCLKHMVSCVCCVCVILENWEISHMTLHSVAESNASACFHFIRLAIQARPLWKFYQTNFHVLILWTFQLSFQITTKENENKNVAERSSTKSIECSFSFHIYKLMCKHFSTKNFECH